MTARLGSTGWMGAVGLLLAAAAATLGCERRPPVGKRVIVLGFDGMDHGITRRLLAEGRLPNLQRLAVSGVFMPLETSVPPQSPVAWSDFTTGLDAGGHGIFDFLHRDPVTLLPYLSTSRTTPASRSIRVGPWQFPLTGGGVELLRHGVPFWEVLEEHGVSTTVIRMPANFPPSGTATRELSGMGTPDLLGTSGTFSLYSTAVERSSGSVRGGVVYRLDGRDGAFHGTLRGPPNPFRRDGGSVTAGFTVYADRSRPVVLIVLGDQEVLLREREWSRWLAVEFDLIPVIQKLRGICRFYVKRVHPDVELYVTPINLDPMNPAMPISTPERYAAELAAQTGRFYTQGMPQETNALRAGLFDTQEFLRQASIAALENRRQYWNVLAQFSDGLLFYYFGTLDQVSHMLWAASDTTHPAYDPVRDAAYADVIDGLYQAIDTVVGETLDRVDDETTLIVMSDHGFAPWTRSVNLNRWLVERGYLTLRRSTLREATLFEHVDWRRTRAYALGLTGLYLNLAGREARGTVSPEEAPVLLDEIAGELLALTDPKTGAPAVTNVYRRDEVFENRGYRDVGPDLIIGYGRGTRGSDASALGQITGEVFADNTGSWSGDHLMDHRVVPGVLFSNRPLRQDVVSLRDLAGAIVAEFGPWTFPPPYDTSRTTR